MAPPPLYRYLPKTYVEAFFTDGSLRLSSFRSFHQHSDEQRLDVWEGFSTFFHATADNGGQTIMARIIHGRDCYVLSASAIHDEDLEGAFDCDSYIQINDSTNFGMAVARHIPGIRAGIEGPCFYQQQRMFIRDLGGYVDLKTLAKDGLEQEIDPQKLKEFVTARAAHWPLFLKDMAYSHQAEYRFVWKATSDTSEFLDIEVPEAREFCSPPSSL